MSEKPRVLSHSTTPETERVPEAGQTPRVTDTLMSKSDNPEPEFHAEALANAVVDNEAGAVKDEEIGGIVPLKRKP